VGGSAFVIVRVGYAFVCVGMCACVRESMFVSKRDRDGETKTEKTEREKMQEIECVCGCGLSVFDKVLPLPIGP